MAESESTWAFDRKTWIGIVCDRDLWLCTLALTFVLVLTSLLNRAAFPFYDTVYSGTRDISVFSGSVICACMALIATWRPQWLKRREIDIVTGILLIGGCALSVYGVGARSALLTVVGASLFSMGRMWVSVMVGVAASNLPRQRMPFCIALAFAFSSVLNFIFDTLPRQTDLILFYALPFICFLLVFRIAAPIVDAQQCSEAPGDMAITRPSSFVPLAGQLFVCLFLFKVAFGYSLRFGAYGGAPVTSFVAYIPVFLVVAWLLTHDRPFPADTLTRVSVLFVVAGFLSVFLVAVGYEALATTIIDSGSHIFEIVSWMVLIAIGSRNRLGAIPAIAWGLGVNGLGSIVGAFIGNYVNGIFGQDPNLVFLVTSTMILVFVSYAMFGLRRFSFDATIADITPVVHEPVAIVTKSDAERFDERCASIAGEYALTPRELEVFKMLARGRNSVYIQDELVVSRNTVKAHVKHIYGKLGIHSHQDLLDLVE